MGSLAASELILNKDGSIYHLNLLPENLAETVIFVGDPDRVERITRHFDQIEFVVRKREFHTQTGTFRGKRISVVSTGIGTDNIDIVMNELDALVNINFKTRTINEQKRKLKIVRIGTSGSIQPEIPVDSYIRSDLAVGFDALLHFYESDKVQLKDFNQALDEQLQLSDNKSKPYVVAGDEKLAKRFAGDNIHAGFTGTNIGFYGPQGRVLRLPLQDAELNKKLQQFSFKGKKVTNLEMETAGIYGLAGLLGHKTISMNAIIANRATGEFSGNPKKTVAELIELSLERLAAE